MGPNLDPFKPVIRRLQIQQDTQRNPVTFLEMVKSGKAQAISRAKFHILDPEAKMKRNEQSIQSMLESHNPS